MRFPSVAIIVGVSAAVLTSCSDPREHVRVIAKPPAGKVTGRVQPLAAAPMSGPFTDASMLCSGWAQGLQGVEELGPCKPMSASSYDGPLPAAVAPFRAVALLERPSKDDKHCALAVQTERGWFVKPLGACETAGSGEDFIRYGSLRTQPGGAGRVQLSLHADETSRHRVDGGHEHRSLVVCGVDESALPLCAEILVESTIYESFHDIDEATAYYERQGQQSGATDMHPPVVGHYRIDVSVGPDGLVRAGEPARTGEVDAGVVMGSGVYELRRTSDAGQPSQKPATTSDCAAACSGPVSEPMQGISRCVIRCLLEHCRQGQVVCPPASCREIGTNLWSCDASCAVDGQTRYEPLTANDCITGSGVHIGREDATETDDCSQVATYSFDCHN